MFFSSPISSFASFSLFSAIAWAAGITVNVTGKWLPHGDPDYCPAAITSVDEFVLKAAITNHGWETINLLNDPNSIVTPHKTEMFDLVGPNGKTPTFGGLIVKWNAQAAIAANRVTTIEPGQTVEFEHDMSGAYNLTESGAGDYKIGSRIEFHALTSSGQLTTITANLDPHSAHISGKLSSSNPLSQHTKLASRKNGVSFVGCSSDRQDDIRKAAKLAQGLITSASSYLKHMDKDSERYRTWFGKYTSDRFNLVKSHYSKMTNDPLSTKYDCSTCDTDDYAYVYGDKPAYIYLCGSFWPAPLTGTDSKAGTIVHETSHFAVNGGTADNAYGQDDCKALAKQHPGKAVRNADSHEYFAENNPALS
ncbi:hypothetical protein FRB99_001978 [Tulasnella sp. 403]|nr:hypothetical protein FRB99_001978 [Tulasnella sp. 403]